LAAAQAPGPAAIVAANEQTGSRYPGLGHEFIAKRCVLRRTIAQHFNFRAIDTSKTNVFRRSKPIAYQLVFRTMMVGASGVELEHELSLMNVMTR
jgi:hypothetical protein